MSFEFKWDDELVEEYTSRNMLGIARMTIEQFKESKQPKTVLTTTDGVDYYEGEIKEIYGVHPLDGYNAAGAWCIGEHSKFVSELRNNYKYFFHSKESAKEFILYNKPLLSLNEIEQLGQIQDSDQNIYFKRLVKAAKDKLK